MKFTRLFLFLLLFISAQVKSQQPFWNDIQNFKKQDSTNPPPKNAILFVGSSSFTKWTDVQSYFPKYTIINRGFGGSTLVDVIRYANDIIFPYNPKQIVIYCGENDLAFSDTVSAQLVFNRFKQLFDMIQNKIPGENIVYISIKPSPSRASLMPKMIEANKLIKQFLSKYNNTTFIDVYYLMLKADGTPLEEIFIKDNLHMNAKGYAIWQKAIQPFLLKN